MFSLPPIAVVGVSALFPGSLNAEHFWRNIVGGADLVSDASESDDTRARRAGLPSFELSAKEFGITAAGVAATDAARLLAFVVAKRVLEDVAGGDFSHLDRDRVSVVL